MKNQMIKKIIVLIILIIFLGCQNGFIFAMNFSGGEFRPRPQPGGGGTSPGGGNTGVQDDPPASSDDIRPVPYIAGISGNVSEVIEAINEQEIGNRGQDSSGIISQKGVKNIYVYADNGASTKTDDNGEYKFDLGPGQSINKITFKYGYLDDDYINNTTVDNYKERQEILKYNGQDYSVVADEYTNTIKLSQKGCAQVYLVLDCSISMNDEITLSNGLRKTKLEIEKEIARKIVNSLLDGNKNIYVGLVVFTGEVYRRTSLTNDKNVLINSINGNIEFNDEYYTNIKDALKKAYDSYANNEKETSNRHMFLLSDGLPTADGDEAHTLYEANTPAEIDENNRKLQLIAENTKEEVKNILREEVKLYSIFAMDDSDEFDNNLINYIFNDFQEYSEYNTFKKVDTIENVTSEIIQDFVEYVNGSIEIVSTGHRIDKNYREDILQNNFINFNYDNTHYFEALDMEVTSENLEIFKEYLGEIVKNTTVTVVCNTSVTGGTPITPYEVTIDHRNDADEIIRTEVIKYVPVPEIVRGPELKLQQLPEFTLNPKMSITGLAVINSNGMVIDRIATTVEENKNLISTIEENMLYGSEVRLQCTVDLRNTSIYNDCENVQVLCYIPDNFDYKGATAVGIGKDGEKQLGIKGARVINKKNVESIDRLTQDVVNYIKSGHTMVAISVDVKKDGFQLLTNGSVQIKVIVSKLLSSKLEDMTYKADSEIYGYKNESCRRIQYKATSTNNLSSQAVGLIGEIAGNHDVNEADYATTSNLGIVLTPTGKDKRVYKIYIIIGILIIIAIIIIEQMNINAKKKKEKNK